MGKWLQSCIPESSAKQLSISLISTVHTVRFSYVLTILEGGKKTKISNSEFNITSIVSDQDDFKVQTCPISPVHSSYYIVFVISS